MPVFDRAEDASFYAKYFSQFISNGVFPNPSTNMQVLATEGMNVKVDIGTCFINGYMGWVEPAEIFEIEESDIQSRIDRVVAKLDFIDKSIKIFIKKGIAQGNPVAPELQRDYDIYEIGLADIRVNANAIEITQSNITDLRFNSELCGIVTGVIEQVDTTTLFNQYTDWLLRTTGQAEIDLETIKQNFNNDIEKFQTSYKNWFEGFCNTSTENFDTWFESIKGKLSGDVAGNLQNQVDELKNRKEIIISEDEPNTDCIWYQVIRTRTKEDDDTVVLETAEMDGNETYIIETDGQERKITNIDEVLENDGNIVLEEI